MLSAKYGPSKAKEMVVKELTGNKEFKLGSQSYMELFDPKLTVIYFANLKDLIYDNWNYSKIYLELIKVILNIEWKLLINIETMLMQRL